MNAALAMHKTTLTSSLPVPVNQGFTFTDNTVTMTLEELQAKMANVYNQEKGGFRKVVVCYNCNNEGHLARDCIQQPRQHSLRQMQNWQPSMNQGNQGLSQTNEQQQRLSCSTQKVQSQHQGQRLPRAVQQQDRSQVRLVQPTLEQLQMFQQFVQQQAKEKMLTQHQLSLGTKRTGSFNTSSSGQPMAKRINRGPWPPLGTGQGVKNQKRPSALTSVQETLVYENEQSDPDENQDLLGGMAAVGGNFMEADDENYPTLNEDVGYGSDDK